MRAKSPTTTDRVLLALSLLEELSAAGADGLSASTFMEEQNIGPEELDCSRELILTLADRESGARVIIEECEGRLHLTGAAGRILPLRLSLSEGLVLAHLVDKAALDDEVKSQLENALVPLGAGAALQNNVSSTSMLGPWISALNEAIEDGVRIQLEYRSGSEEAARTRTVDPIKIETADGFAYLVAWDIDADGPRRYRFDRISGVETTDESVERHDEIDDLRSGLAHTGKIARISLPTRIADDTTWAGITEKSPCADDAERSILSVRFTSETWLFEQVLAGGGNIRIESDPELANRFCIWARSLKK